MTIISITNADPQFYPLVGPFLSRRDIEAEMGGRIYDEDDKHWFVALSGKRVLGFCAAIERRGAVHCSSAYVVPSERKRGVYRMLVEHRDAWVNGRRASATCTKVTGRVLRAIGFKKRSERGRFIKMERAAHGV